MACNSRDRYITFWDRVICFANSRADNNDFLCIGYSCYFTMVIC